MSTRGRRVTVLLVLLAAAVGGLLAWTHHESTGGVPADRTPAPEATPAAPVLVGRPGAGLPDAAPPTRGEASAPEPPPGPDTVPVRLTWSRPGFDAREVKVTLLTDAPDPPGYTELVFTRESTEGRVARAGRYQVEPIFIDGWASDQWAEHVTVGPDGRIELELDAPGTTTLVVVDSATGRSLASARAHPVAGMDEILEDMPAPTEESLEARSHEADGAGRIPLPKTTRSRDWWVGAPDHAWRRVRTAPDLSELRVGLGSGGAIRAHLAPESELDAYLVVAVPVQSDVPEDGRSDAAWMAESAPMRFEVTGLSPGPWRVVVGRLDRLWVDEVWASVDVDVQAAATTEVRVVVPRRPVAERRMVNLVLTIPAAWRASVDRVTVSGEDSGNESISKRIEIDAEASGGSVALPLEGLLLGWYEIELLPLDWSRLVRIDADRTEVRLDVPPPVEVRVFVLDEATGEPIPSARVSVSSLPTTETAPTVMAGRPGSDYVGGVGWGGEDAEREGPGGPFRVRVPAGLTEASVSAPGFVHERVREVFTASDEPSEIRVRLRRGASVRVRIVREGVVVQSARGEGECEAALPDGATWRRSRDLDNGIAEIGGLTPGEYVVRWTDGPLPHPPEKRVTLRAGERTVVDFEAPPD